MNQSDARARPQAEPPRREASTVRLSPEGRINAWSEAAGRLLGGDLEPGRALAELFPGAAMALREGLSGGGPEAGFCVAPLGARSGKALALVCRPLPEGGWEAELLPLTGGSGREAEILSELLHDLRTPLTTLLGAAELLETGRLGALPERASALLRALEGAGTQITGMLERAAARRDTPEAS